VKLIFAYSAFDAGQVYLIAVSQSSLYYAFYVEQQTTLVIFGGAFAGIDEGVPSVGANSACFNGVKLMIEDDFRLLDLKVV
jgi:hypothetical protein